MMYTTESLIAYVTLMGPLPETPAEGNYFRFHDEPRELWVSPRDVDRDDYTPIEWAGCNDRERNISAVMTVWERALTGDALARDVVRWVACNLTKADWAVVVRVVECGHG